jgi:hypothetical protein
MGATTEASPGVQPTPALSRDTAGTESRFDFVRFVAVLLPAFFYPTCNGAAQLVVLSALLFFAAFRFVASRNAPAGAAWLGAAALSLFLADAWQIAIVIAAFGYVDGLAVSRGPSRWWSAYACWAALLLVEAHPLMWGYSADVSFWLSRVLKGDGGAIGGPAYVGLPFALWTVVFGVGYLVSGTDGLIKRVPIALAFVAAGIYASVWDLGSLVVVASAVLYGRLRPFEPPRARTGLRGYLWLAACLAAGVMAYSGAFQRAIPAGKTMLLSVGLGATSMPTESELRPVEPIVARFGALSPVMAGYGWKTVVAGAGGPPAAFERYSLVCVVNPDKAPTDEQMRKIEEYVKSGGTLLVLGDHTNIGGILKPLNAWLGFTAIRFNDDSAISSEEHSEWGGALQTACRRPFWGRTNRDFHVSVGASLACRYPAVPMVQGTFGFSDKSGGTQDGVGLLGNMQLDPGERTGSVCLAAAQNVGRGKVVVFGDTSGLQDGSLGLNHGWVDLLLSNSALARPVFPGWLELLGLFGVLAVALAGNRQRNVLWVAWLGIGAVSAGLFALDREASPDSYRGAAGTFVDCSHLPAYPGLKMDWRHYTAAETISRSGTLPLNAGSLDWIEKADRWLIVAPCKPYTDSEAERIKAWVANGGLLLVAYGPEHRSAMRNLEEAFGFSLTSEYAGSAPVSTFALQPTTERRRLLKAAGKGAISFVNATAVDSEFEPVTTNWGLPIASKGRWGKGWVAVVGDPLFFVDVNLGQGSERKVEANHLILELLEKD